MTASTTMRIYFAFFFNLVNLLLFVMESSKGCLFQEDPRYGEGTVSIKKALMSLLDGSDADETFLQKWYGNVYCCCDQSGTSRDMVALQSVALRCVRTVNYVELHSWAPVKKSCQIFMTTMSIRSVDNWKCTRDYEKAEVQ